MKGLQRSESLVKLHMDCAKDARSPRSRACMPKAPPGQVAHGLQLAQRLQLAQVSVDPARSKGVRRVARLGRHSAVVARLVQAWGAIQQLWLVLRSGVKTR